MGYVSKEMKVELVKRIKEVLPKGWKATFKVYNLSKLRVMIKSAPITLDDIKKGIDNDYISVHPLSRASDFNNIEVGKIIENIGKALESKNYTVVEDSNYGNVPSYYTELTFGDSSKPFISTKNI